MSAVSLLADACLLLACFLLITGAVGFLRFPDFYSRVHAAGVTETLAAFLILLALFLDAGGMLARAKLGLILLFIFFSSPTAAHALAKAAWNSGIRPRNSDGKTDASIPPEHQ